MPVKPMTPTELHQALSEQRVTVIDVREPAEYNAGHIQGATLIPLAQLLPTHVGSGTVVFQCRTGGRSHAACELILKANPEAKVYNLTGGIVAWIDAGYPVVQ